MGQTQHRPARGVMTEDQMGTWGPGVFENDETVDFIWEVEEGGLDALRDAFEQILDAAGRPEAWAESTAVGAAAIVAAAFDGKDDLLPEASRAFLADLRGAITEDPGLLQSARRVVHGVLTGDSELLELWRASGESNEAIRAIREVQSRLND